MIEPATCSLIFNAVRTGGTVIDEKKRNQFILKMKWLITKRKKIVVFGISGAGKSQFINSLKKCLEIPTRTLTTDKTSHDIEEFPIVFIDTPGHGERVFERKKEITNILKNGVGGIINVVSYGYEENPDSQVGDIFDSKDNVKESFLKLNRKVEIERLAEWVPQISPTDIHWIINLDCLFLVVKISVSMLFIHFSITKYCINFKNMFPLQNKCYF